MTVAPVLDAEERSWREATARRFQDQHHHQQPLKTDEWTKTESPTKKQTAVEKSNKSKKTSMANNNNTGQTSQMDTLMRSFQRQARVQNRPQNSLVPSQNVPGKRAVRCFWRRGMTDHDFLDANGLNRSCKLLMRDLCDLTRQARYFIIKSYSALDIIQSIVYGCWSSTDRGSRRLSTAYRQTRGPIYLFFSVNGSGQFQGLAQMDSDVDWRADLQNIWQEDAADMWTGGMDVHWLCVKNVGMRRFSHICNELNEGKPVPVSRDAQEVDAKAGEEMLHIFRSEPYRNSLAADVLSHMSRLQL